jgi:O-antigen/teichoic acid export membrane protein
MSVAEVRERAAGGAVAVGGRTVAINLLALAGGVVLARLLTPEDFGVVAIGTTVTTLGILLADGGIGAALIRGRREPDRGDLEALLATQLLVGFLVVAVAAAIAIPVGGVAGRAVPVMAIAVPLTALRTPGLVTLERQLSYRPLAFVEVIETVAYYLWAVVTVAAFDFGVWGLATAPLMRAGVGSVGTAVAAGLLTLRPRPSWTRTRQLLAFGLQFQLYIGTAFARDAGLVAGTARIGGTASAGIWSVARRLLDLPIHLHQALARVAFPAMSRLLAAGGQPGPVLRRATGTVAIGTALMTVALGGAAPALVPAVLGSQWTAAIDPVALGSVALMISLPVTVPANGFLWAAGEAKLMVRSQMISAVVWLGVSLPLLPTFGVSALGIGWVAQSAVEVMVIERATKRLTGVSLLRPWLGPAVAAAIGGAVSWMLASQGASTLPRAVLAAGAGALLAIAVMGVTSRRQLRGTLLDLRRLLPSRPRAASVTADRPPATPGSTSEPPA